MLPIFEIMANNAPFIFYKHQRYTGELLKYYAASEHWEWYWTFFVQIIITSYQCSRVNISKVTRNHCKQRREAWFSWRVACAQSSCGSIGWNARIQKGLIRRIARSTVFFSADFVSVIPLLWFFDRTSFCLSLLQNTPTTLPTLSTMGRKFDWMIAIVYIYSLVYWLSRLYRFNLVN